MKYIGICFICLLLFVDLCSCVNSNIEVKVVVDYSDIINDKYIGNGVQWDPYQLDYGKGKLTIPTYSWRKIYNRLDFMHPQFIRVMLNTNSFLDKGEFDPTKGLETLMNILYYCESRGVIVMLGDWGGSLISKTENLTFINKSKIRYAAEVLDYLLNTLDFTCIKYYNLINEPNGYWSATDGSYTLWAQAIREFYSQLNLLGLSDKVSIAGPDIAIWDTDDVWWIDSTYTYLSDIVELYDIHTYPSKRTVNTNQYSEIISEYKNHVPNKKKIIMGEIGLKFVDPLDSLYQKENIERASEKKYASLEDSQMFVYDYIYGIDMADALIQTVNSGYSGAIAWMLDDAMHSAESLDKLKVWGFWNILGEEFDGDDSIRPWYYSWSLLTKYLPTGSKIYRVNIVGSKSIKAIASESNGKYTLGLLNISKEENTVLLKGLNMETLKDCKKIVYSKENIKHIENEKLYPDLVDLEINLVRGESVILDAESLVVFTNLKY